MTKTHWPLTPTKPNARMARVEEVAQQLRAVPRGQTEAEQMIRLRQSCVRLSGPILAQLYRCFTDKVMLSKEQLKAAEMVLDRAVPKLQQVQVRQMDDDELHSEEQVVKRIATLIQQHPELLQVIDGAVGRTVVDGEAEEIDP